MEQLWQVLDSPWLETKTLSLSGFMLSLILAFVLGQVFAWVYYATHSGLSYSRSFVQSLILITVVVAMVMTVIGNSLITAVGLMGALAIIRFRNILKDTRDMTYVFCVLVVGMAAGSQHFGVAILGTIVLCSIAFYLFHTSFGTHEPHNGFLRFRLLGGIRPDHPVLVTLQRFCSSLTLISVQDVGKELGAEYAYQLMIRDNARNEEMLSELEKIRGIEGIYLTMQEELLEV